MRKIAFVFTALAMLLLLFCSCEPFLQESSSSKSEESSEKISEVGSQSESASESETQIDTSSFPTVKYISGEGGTIIGLGEQRVAIGERTEEVRVKADSGYRFIGWNDGIMLMRRSDLVNGDATYIARFEKFHTVTFACDSKQGTISGKAVQHIDAGESTTEVTASPSAGFRFLCWDNGEASPTIKITPTDNAKITAIFVPSSLQFPAIHIDTEGSAPIVSKEEYLNCYITVSNTAQGYAMEGALGQVRGRGNTSFQVDKCSYKIKFDERTDLFGMGDARDWALISNHFDLSIVRNYIAYAVASKFETQQFASKNQFVDLYVNGEYRGVYLVCEQVEVQENRVNITEGSTEVDTGYLIELDSRAEDRGFYVFGKFHAIKTPNPNKGELSSEQMTYIFRYVSSAHSTILKKSWSEVCELVDVESFAEAYIIYELFKCVDVGFASFYMYKEAGGKLTAGPVWDFDRSMGNVENKGDSRYYDTLWARKDNMWFLGLFMHEEFEMLVREKLEKYLPTIRQTLEACYIYLEAHEESFNRNFERWDILGGYVYPNPSELNRLQTWREHLDWLKVYIENSLNFMVKTYPPTGE
ncbi:MAG: CotH kinase family protein [Clostridia bacterium]|nr:CotH kinase family protein [Clostridia bacterium]MBQ8739737.1 CotH kinase family protein [Clostridia bacterium]